MHASRSPFVLLALAACLAAALTVAPPVVPLPASPVAAADPTPSSPQTVRFMAGVVTAYKFSSTGAITASKSATFIRPSSASSTDRRSIPGRGIHLYMSNGVYAGYWVPESSVAYIPGIVGRKTFAATAVSFPAGVYLGYSFTSTWGLAGTRKGTITGSSMAHATSTAVINGRAYVGIADGIWAGYWIPGTLSRPTAIGCRAGNRVAAGSAQIFRSVSTTSRKLSLTFDMGGRLDPAQSILDLLIVDRICATVFATGDAASTTAGTAVLAKVRAHPELFELGNHTMHHCDLVSGGGGSTAYCPAGRPSAAFIRSELTSAASIIVTKGGQSPAPYWRPPYGSYDSTVTAAAAAAGYTKTFLWSIDTIDWRPLADGGPTALDIATKVRAGAVPGSIVLMHLGGYNTLDGLPYTLAGLRSKSLLPTSLSDLLH